MGLLVLNPIGKGGVGESHFARIVTFIPLGMAIGEHDILALAMNLPEFCQRGIGRTAYAVLRIIILVRIQQVKLQTCAIIFGSRRVAAQDICRGK